MEYTKKELAEICGVSVQAIDKKLRKTGLMDACNLVAGKLHIPATIAATIAADYQAKLKSNAATKTVAEVAASQQPTAVGSVPREVYEDLRAQLRLLQVQIEVKDSQIADLSAALVSAHEAVTSAQETAKAAQALHAAEKAEALAIEAPEKQKSRWQRLRAAWKGEEAR